MKNIKNFEDLMDFLFTDEDTVKTKTETLTPEKVTEVFNDLNDTMKRFQDEIIKILSGETIKPASTPLEDIRKKDIQQNGPVATLTRGAADYIDRTTSSSDFDKAVDAADKYIIGDITPAEKATVRKILEDLVTVTKNQRTQCYGECTAAEKDIKDSMARIDDLNEAIEMYKKLNAMDHRDWKEFNDSYGNKFPDRTCSNSLYMQNTLDNLVAGIQDRNAIITKFEKQVSDLNDRINIMDASITQSTASASRCDHVQTLVENLISKTK